MINFAEEEKKILEFWNKDKTFAKSLAKDSPKGEYTFYDGPPFATGLPHYGHIVASVMKDVVPRYQTMQGYHVARKWGWDCHGLPIENIVEKDLKLKTKDDIDKLGVDKFNSACRRSVLKYADEWYKFIPRIGRWVDMDHDYKTMDLSYMESIWWVFKKLYDKKLIYEGYKSMHICPRCETTLSNFEVTQNYKDIKDLSVIVKFELVDEPGTYLLAWTTTPWTLPGNVALALSKKVTYVRVKIENSLYIMAKDNVEQIAGDKKFEIIKKVDLKDLIGREYRPLFNYYEHYVSEAKKGLNIDSPSSQVSSISGRKVEDGLLKPMGDDGKFREDKDFLERKKWINAYKILEADFVTAEDGTGIVHIAPAFGEDDLNLGQTNDLPFVQHVDESGKFKPEVKDFAGAMVKPIGDHQTTDIEIIRYLAGKELLFAKQKYEHSYPHCWRCDTPLLNYATSSWFIKVTAIKDKMLKNNSKINWQPEHIKDGRFGKWLENARDWAVSRQRYWGAGLPIWKNEKDEVICIGSIEELEKLSGQKINDLHRPFIDDITWKDKKGTWKRIPDVLDCWFESGSMPYAQEHYPFENKKEFEKNFPAQFIAEGQDQTRGWFYTLIVLATALFNKPAFKNVIVNGIVLAEDGAKMSKRLRNYPDPIELIDKYSADALRYYLLTSPVMKATDLRFVAKDVGELYRNLIMTTTNIVSFYKMYADSANIDDKETVLDEWINIRGQQLIKTVTDNMEAYKLVEAARPLLDYVNDFSTWYIRRSRGRFKNGSKAAVQTTKQALEQLAKVMAPFTPFLAEWIWQELGYKDSVHLENWPKTDKLSSKQETALLKMTEVRKVVEKAHAARDEAGIKVRQPLHKLKVQMTNVKADEVGYLGLIVDEINVKEVELVDKLESEVELDTSLTSELEQEGLLRDLVRQINFLRKKSGLTINDRISVVWQSDDKMIKGAFTKFETELKKQVLADNIKEGVDKGAISEEVQAGKAKVKITLIK